MHRTRVLLLLAAVTIGCTISRPSTGATGRTAPQMTTVAREPRDTLFARAFAAMKERGYTEITPDAPAAEVRGKSPRGTSVIVAFNTMGDSTQVTVTAGAGGPRGPGIDSEALATVLTLMSDITRPRGAVADSTRKP
ncbi:MAG: hypothetical protein ACJ79K_15145 [Gemmatimonadaceae bacterium]